MSGLFSSSAVGGYFDFNATTPLADAAWAEGERARKHWHNPSSLYREAAAVKRRLEEAREELGGLLGCDPERIVFTGGATESNNALLATLAGVLDPAGRVMSSAIEHPSVREPLRRWFGERVILAGTDAEGGINLEEVGLRMERGGVVLVTAMAANNESGLLHPWRELGALCRVRGVPFHTDAAQWIGKMPATELGECDYVTGCAHKFGGPKGVGFLMMRDEREALSFLRGGPQEEGRRAGTENYPGIAAMMAALRTVTPDLDRAAETQAARRDAFEAVLRRAFPGLRVIGAGARRLWNTSMFVLPRHDHRKWLARLSQRGFCVSTGSACSAGHEGSSAVLAALGADAAEMRRVIRVSGGWDTPVENWEALGRAFVDVGAELDAGTGGGDYGFSG